MVKPRSDLIITPEPANVPGSPESDLDLMNAVLGIAPLPSDTESDSEHNAGVPGAEPRREAVVEYQAPSLRGVPDNPLQAMSSPALLGDAPALHLTERQFVWISHRLSLSDDLEACVAAAVEPDEVIEWRKEPAFTQAIANALRDKRGNFRPLTTNLLPLALRTIYAMISSENARERKDGMNMLLRSQGLFVDTIQTVDAESVGSLMDRLRQPVQVQIIDMEPRK